MITPTDSRPHARWNSRKSCRPLRDSRLQTGTSHVYFSRSCCEHRVLWSAYQVKLRRLKLWKIERSKKKTCRYHVLQGGMSAHFEFDVYNPDFSKLIASTQKGTIFPNQVQFVNAEGKQIAVAESPVSSQNQIKSLALLSFLFTTKVFWSPKGIFDSIGGRQDPQKCPR